MSRSPSGNLASCSECMEHVTPLTMEACASVALSRGRTFQAVLAEYLEFYHLHDHQLV